MSVHTDLLEKYPILKLEYNNNGTFKSYEELCVDNNNELINDIVKYRFNCDIIHNRKK